MSKSEMENTGKLQVEHTLTHSEPDIFSQAVLQHADPAP